MNIKLNMKITDENIKQLTEFIKELMTSVSKGFFGGGICKILFVIFITLKLSGVINWSWWWVTAPIWGGIALYFLIFLLVIILIYGIYLLTN